MIGVRDDTATVACPVCTEAFEPSGRRRFCSTECRQSAWRRSRRAPVEPVVARSDTVYECPDCDARYIGEQRCEECNSWCRRIGPGGTCPCCEEPVAIADLLTTEQFAAPARAPKKRR